MRPYHAFCMLNGKMLEMDKSNLQRYLNVFIFGFWFRYVDNCITIICSLSSSPKRSREVLLSFCLQLFVVFNISHFYTPARRESVVYTVWILMSVRPSIRHTFGFRIIIKVPLNQIFSNFHTLLCTIKYRLIWLRCISHLPFLSYGPFSLRK